VEYISLVSVETTEKDEVWRERLHQADLRWDEEHEKRMKCEKQVEMWRKLCEDLKALCR
jgi:hypothetical protein